MRWSHVHPVDKMILGLFALPLTGLAASLLLLVVLFVQEAWRSRSTSPVHPKQAFTLTCVHDVTRTRHSFYSCPSIRIEPGRGWCGVQEVQGSCSAVAD
jgi:hypothetical protein